jgi:CBS domain containing-hemolysin-like protein
MKIKDLMTPVSEYTTLGTDAVFSDLVVALQDSKHRDVIIVDDKDAFVGILTMTDILLALEPNYKKLERKELSSDILTNKWVSDLFTQFNLWSDTMSEICKKGCSTKVDEAMYTPAEGEYVEENDNIEIAIHKYIVGTHQPLIVRGNGSVTGVIRLSDVFEEGKGALAVFLLAATWWVFEVVPIGVTSLTIGVLQVLFFIRPAKDAFKDFMDPSVLCSSSVPLWWVWCLPKPG